MADDGARPVLARTPCSRPFPLVERSAGNVSDQRAMPAFLLPRPESGLTARPRTDPGRSLVRCAQAAISKIIKETEGIDGIAC
jgi:hypothetical protein